MRAVVRVRRKHSGPWEEKELNQCVHAFMCMQCDAHMHDNCLFHVRVIVYQNLNVIIIYDLR